MTRFAFCRGNKPPVPWRLKSVPDAVDMPAKSEQILAQGVRRLVRTNEIKDQRMSFSGVFFPNIALVLPAWLYFERVAMGDSAQSPQKTVMRPNQ